MRSESDRDKDGRVFWFLRELGLEVTGESGDERICTCPFCGKEQHLYLNALKLVFECKVCTEKGNYEALLGKLAETVVEGFTADRRARLARDRNLPPEAFDGYGFGWTGRFYTLPVADAAGRVVSVLRYSPGDKLKPGPSCRAALFGAPRLLDGARRHEPVYVTEGQWDAIALEYARARAGEPGVVVAVPGANVFKTEWVDWLRGRDVYLCYDNDAAGAQGELKAASLLAGAAKSIHFFQWKDGEHSGKDLRDLIGGAL